MSAASARQWLQDSDAARQRGDHRAGAAAAQSALTAAQAAGDEDGAAQAQSRLALHLLRLGEPEAGVAAARAALARFTSTGDRSAQSGVHSTLALAYESVALSDQALVHAAEALQAARQGGDQRAECWALYRLGTSIDDAEDLDRGLNYTLQSLALARRIGAPEETFSALNNLAHQYQGKADRLIERGLDPASTLQAAAEAADGALAEARRSGQQYGVVVALSNRAAIQRRLGLPEAARESFLAAAELAREQGYQRMLTAIEFGLALLACRDDHPNADIAALEQMLQRPAATTDPQQRLRAHRALYQLHARQGRHELALAQLEQLYQLDLQLRAQRSSLQARLLISQVDIEQARHAAERARLEGEMQRLRAEETERAAQQLHRDRDLLEQQVAARTAELQQAKEAAESANRAKNAFLANMSHELRTPLNGLLGMAELALRRAQDPRQIEQLREGMAAGRHLRDLINDLLDLTAIDSRRLPLNEQEVPLRPLMDEVLQLLQTSAQGKGLRLSVAIDPRLPGRVWGDPVRLKQILLNYGGNAIKFSERGEIQLRALLLPDAGPGLLLRFEVVDQGQGIEAWQQARLFELFAQVDDSSTRRHGGMGLGLAIASRIAELMGGQVGVDSRPGQGSTFWATVRLSPVPGAAPPADPEALSQRLRQQFAGTRVLLAEDLPLNRDVAVAMLEDVGLVVDVVPDGLACVAAASRGRYALILMDLQMPLLGGLEAARRIRALPAGQSVPILALTASAYDDDRRQCLQAGMNDHLSKPLDMAQLHEAVLKALLARDGTPG